MISLSVKTLDGQTQAFELNDDILVREFKDIIHREMSIPVNQIRLIFQGKVLQETQKLSEVGVDGKVVHLVRREPPWNRRESSSGQSSRSASASGREGHGGGSGGGGGGGGGGRDGGISLEEQLDAEMLRSMIQEILSGMGDVARMATVVTEQTEEGGFDIEVSIPPGVQRRSLARMRQRYVGAIESQARAVARWLEDPHQYTSPQPDYVVLRRSERSVDPTLDDSDAAEAGGASTDAAATGTTSQSGRNAQTTAPETSTPPREERSQRGAEDSRDDSDTPALNPVAASELADMVDSVESLWRDVRPLIDHWQNLLREDPEAPEDEAVTNERQRLHDGVSRLLHLQSHMLHNISDFIVEFNSAPPRRLLVMAESPMQSMSARINIDTDPLSVPFRLSRAAPAANSGTTRNSSSASTSPVVGISVRSGSRERSTPSSAAASASGSSSTSPGQGSAPNSGAGSGANSGPGGAGRGRGNNQSASRSPFLRFLLPAMSFGAGSLEGMGVVTSGPGLVTGHPGIRTQRGQTSDGTPYVWASAGPHIDYEMRPDMFAVNSTWTHVISDTGAGGTQTSPGSRSDSTQQTPASSQRQHESRQQQQQTRQQSQQQQQQQTRPSPPQQQQQQQQQTPPSQQQQQQNQQQRPNNLQREIYSRVLEQTLRQTLMANPLRPSNEPDQGSSLFGAQSEHILGNGSTWNNVDPYLGCNSRHFVDFISSTTDAGGRRVYTASPMHQFVIDPRFGVFPGGRHPQHHQQQNLQQTHQQQPQQQRQTGTTGNGQSSGQSSQARSGGERRGAASADGSLWLADLLTQRLGLNMGAIEDLMSETLGSFIEAPNLPPMGSNIIFDSVIVSSDVLEVGNLLRAALARDHSGLDRLRSPLRDLYRRRLEERSRQTPGSPTEVVHAMVDDALKDRVFLDHPLIARITSAFNEWLSERNGLPPRSANEAPVDWVATMRRMAAGYTSDLILLTMDSPTDVGYGQLLFDEGLTSYREVYSLMRTHASAADMMSLLQRLINCFVENLTVLPMQMLVQTLASVNHSSMESAHQNMSEAARQALRDRWLVRKTSSSASSSAAAPAGATAMDIDDETEEGFATPPEPAATHHSSSDRPAPPERPLEAHPMAPAIAAAGSEALPSEWREIVPPDWLNVLAQDYSTDGASSGAEENGIEVRPLSDAYISGMPAKRRRLMMAARSARPPGPPREMLQQVMREAFEESRLSGEIAGAEGTAPPPLPEGAIGGSLERAFVDYTTERVGQRLDTNADYERHRYPESEKLFRSGAKRHPSNNTKD